jgi:hypothetical protein
MPIADRGVPPDIPHVEKRTAMSRRDKTVASAKQAAASDRLDLNPHSEIRTPHSAGGGAAHELRLL